MAMRDVIPMCLCLFLATGAGQASGLEPGSPLMAPKRPAAEKESPRAPELSLARFLESPGREPARVKLWLRHNTEARGLEEGAREFLERLIQLSADSPREAIFEHERVTLDAEALATDDEILALADARAALLARQGKLDPDFQVLTGELPPPWNPDGALDREALAGLVFARTGRAAPLPPEVDRLLADLAALDRRLGMVEDKLLPVAEEALGAAVLGLGSGEASMMEVVHRLHFLKHQQRRRLDLRVQRELLLMEVARRAGCAVEALPWAPAPEAG
ncbi:hypothetical protein HPC49_49045 [Pyxidicoccus fallax]|uniref:Uncharacterized protein n=1 Tax=Pyxidicoccus fallax TaxID=394095 RepID=A0A848LYH5_9BACT|nr:hypothetical protein [Pyxidicoccus fallax]NMO23248.1 hypothetical protein [Pyxidicoccus fallax]NPC86121.1 hypothetical protein [Pyxidicoccus fallax]